MVSLSEECRKQSLDLSDVVLWGELLQAAIEEVSLLPDENGTIPICCGGGILLSQLRDLRQLVAEWMCRVRRTAGLLVMLSS